MSLTIKDVAKFTLTQSLFWASRNPLEAIATTAIISNPTTRKILFQIVKIETLEMGRKLTSYSKLIYVELVAPAGRTAVPQIKRAATTPAVAIPAATLAAAAVGAAISSATVVEINKQHNTSGTVWGNWSPFGGFQLGTVV